MRNIGKARVLYNRKVEIVRVGEVNIHNKISSNSYRRYKQKEGHELSICFY